MTDAEKIKAMREVVGTLRDIYGGNARKVSGVEGHVSAGAELACKRVLSEFDKLGEVE